MNEAVVVTVAYGLRLARMRPRTIIHVARVSFHVIQHEQGKTMRWGRMIGQGEIDTCQRSHVLLYTYANILSVSLRIFLFKTYRTGDIRETDDNDDNRLRTDRR